MGGKWGVLVGGSPSSQSVPHPIWQQDNGVYRRAWERTVYQHNNRPKQCTSEEKGHLENRSSGHGAGRLGQLSEDLSHRRAVRAFLASCLLAAAAGSVQVNITMCQPVPMSVIGACTAVTPLV
jgi:hypothetical protein